MVRIPGFYCYGLVQSLFMELRSHPTGHAARLTKVKKQNSLQAKVQDWITSLVYFTKNTRKNLYLFLSNYFKRLTRREYSQSCSVKPLLPWYKNQTNTFKNRKLQPNIFDRWGGHGNPLQYSCLENPMDKEAWWATLHGVTKSQTWLSDWTWVHSHLHLWWM